MLDAANYENVLENNFPIYEYYSLLSPLDAYFPFQMYTRVSVWLVLIYRVFVCVWKRAEMCIAMHILITHDSYYVRRTSIRTRTRTYIMIIICTIFHGNSISFIYL